MIESFENLEETIRSLAGDSARTGELARIVAAAASRFVSPPLYEEYFQLFEENGFHLTPVHYYHPIPDTRDLGDELWREHSKLVGIDMNEPVQLTFLEEVFPRFREEYDSIPHSPEGEPYEFHLDNKLFGGTDALALYCMVRHFQPSLIVEVGAGFSTRVSAQAARRNGDTKLISIEPYPDEIVAAGFPGLSELIPQRVEELDVGFFDRLAAGDFLFVDTSHVVKTGGDVNYLLLEVLPRLRPGVIVHVHDVFLPAEYPRRWLLEMFRFWTEQYLLHAFLLFNREYEVLYSSSYVEHNWLDLMRECFPKSTWWGGLSFWMRRVTETEARR